MLKFGYDKVGVIVTASIFCTTLKACETASTWAYIFFFCSAVAVAFGCIAAIKFLRSALSASLVTSAVSSFLSSAVVFAFGASAFDLLAVVLPAANSLENSCSTSSDSKKSSKDALLTTAAIADTVNKFA